MSLTQKVLSLALGASLLLPLSSTRSEEIFYPVNQFQIKTSAITTNCQNPNLSIELLVDNITNDAMSSQFYSGKLEKTDIAYKVEEKVSQFFSKQGIDSSIIVKKGGIIPSSSNPHIAQKNTDGVIRIFYSEEYSLKKFYNEDPKRFFIDTERESWLDEYYQLNLEKLKPFSGFIDKKGLEDIFKQHLSNNLNEKWNSFVNNEGCLGLTAINTRRIYQFPLVPDFKKVAISNEEQANLLAYVQIHEIFHVLGEKDNINPIYPNIMNPALNMDLTGRNRREMLKPILNGEIQVEEEQITRIKRELKRLEFYGSESNLQIK